MQEIRECYIDYLDCKNNFQETRKYFSSYEDAFEFMLKTFDKVDIDLISYT